MNESGGANGGNQGFSWLDLGATWNFATQNGENSISSAGELDDGLSVHDLNPWGMTLLTDYNYLEGDTNLIF